MKKLLALTLAVLMLCGVAFGYELKDYISEYLSVGLSSDYYLADFAHELGYGEFVPCDGFVALMDAEWVNCFDFPCDDAAFEAASFWDDEGFEVASVKWEKGGELVKDVYFDEDGLKIELKPDYSLEGLKTGKYNLELKELKLKLLDDIDYVEGGKDKTLKKGKTVSFDDELYSECFSFDDETPFRANVGWMVYYEGNRRVGDSDYCSDWADMLSYELSTDDELDLGDDIGIFEYYFGNDNIFFGKVRFAGDAYGDVTLSTCDIVDMESHNPPFPEVADVTVNFRAYEDDESFYGFDAGSDKLNNKVLTKHADDIEGEISFVRFFGADVGSKGKVLFNDTDEDWHVYLVDENGELVESNAKYDDDEGCIALKTSKLGYYCISEDELKAAAAKDDNPNTGK